MTYLRGIPAEDRFWMFTTISDGCWEWHGLRDGRGYGLIRWNGPQIAASRASWLLHFGPIPKGIVVCHRCDNPPCVNPVHLFLGTRADNARDMIAKRRNVLPPRHRGAAAPNAAFTDEQAALIRRLKPTGKAAKAMASEFGVSITTVGRVVRGTTYRGAA